MAFRYTVTVNNPAASAADAALAAAASAAAAQWARYLHGFGSLDIAVSVSSAALGTSILASGAPAWVAFRGQEGGLQVWQSGPARELADGSDLNGAAADLNINVGANFAALLQLDPGGATPAAQYDGLSVLMHEIAHGLGIFGWRSDSDGSLGTYGSPWDRLVTVRADGSAVFTGAYARAIYGGDVPVTTLRNDEQYFHLGNSSGDPASRDLMTGTGLPSGTRYLISDLDLAILKDLGLPVTAGAGGDPLLDPFWYTTRYPDVSAARADAASHFDGPGWREGRDPGSFFSTNGYLAANPDVAAAGVNPLRHFEAHGWREGRDATAAFDNELYLARNPDVRAAGLDPLLHYLTDGRFEGRAAYAAIGGAAAFTHGSFDAEYYLLSNPDVARAAMGQGANSLAFAYAHYEAHGWREGRDPNSVFDVQGYLAAYADVRAAGLDPLLHYDTYGWREGRDPAAGFDTSAYLGHYADVAVTQADPLLHYLRFGALEGRSGFADGQF